MAQQCVGTRKDGGPCQAPAHTGSSLCYVHDPAQAARRIVERHAAVERRRAREATIRRARAAAAASFEPPPR